MRRRGTTHLTVLLFASLLVFTSILVHACIGLELGSISITASPTHITIGQNITISGTIDPPHEENVTIFYREKDKPPWISLPTVTTNATGHYSCNWSTFHMGTYEFKGYWVSDTHAAESPPPYPAVDVVGVHDIAILNVVRSRTEVEVGETVDINVTVKNEGHYNETFDVAVKYNTTTMDTHSVNLAPGAIITESFSWDTTSVTEGTYTISAQVPTVTNETDTTDNSRTDGTVKVTLPNTPPNATFTESAETVYTGEIITFNASDSYDPDGNITSYFWDFGDNTTEFYVKGVNLTDTTGVIVEHSYKDDGNYTVTLSVTDNDGATDNATATKTVKNRSPVASFTMSPEIAYINETIHFNASSSYDLDGNITGYFWDFGDGTTKIYVKDINLTDTTTHAYAGHRNYTVTLKVTDDDGTTSSTNATKTVLNRPPVAVFTESAETVLTNEVIAFDASDSYDPDGNITSYFWDFGDNTTEFYVKGVNLTDTTGVVVEHAYADDGNYTVTLTVTDDDNATDTATATKTVLNRTPVVKFTESADTAYISEAITFNASDSYDPDGNITSYFWDFGDNTTEFYVKGVNLTDTTGVVVEHAYDINGTFTVILNVTDDDGASNSSSSTQTILLNEPPVALFTETAEIVYTGEIIAFSASDSYDPDGNITSYFWDFGDGTDATGVNVSHAYADDGFYTVTLFVTDDDGGTASKTAVKAVMNRPPLASFTENPTTVLTGEIIHFNASDSYDPDGNITSYFWDFGDATDATGVNVSHAYADDGNYTVTLVVTDDDGRTASKTAVRIVANRPPTALFTKNVTTANIDEAIRFDASDSYDEDGSVLSYFWDFGDGTNASMAVILDHIYTENGNYTVTLTVTDDDGSSSSISATVTVKTSTGWPLALIAGIAVGIAVSTGTAIYAIYGRKREGTSKRDQST
ncbi:MAG: PKD domain-containing protein [Candidatus Bathyarchaeia archaeon]